VLDPETGVPFTPSGAWGFVANHFEAGADFEEIILKQPAGRAGYVLTIPMPGGQTLYIKVQLGKNFVIGRSFHYSIHDKAQ
jgi:hypothetical protein